MSEERAAIQEEFERTARTFAERTKGRFDHMDVVSFSRVRLGDTVLEVGAGTGSFLALFAQVARRLIAADITRAMLDQARARFPMMELVVADGARLPFPSRSVDVVACAQMLHHVRRPVDIVKEMRRVVRPEGHVLLVDQVAPERAEEAMMMNELDRLRDPSHAACRPPSAFRVMAQAAGLEIEDESIHSSRERFSTWMPGDEFPSERIAAGERFIAEHGAGTGMEFEREGHDWLYTRRRIQLLARRAG